MRQVQLENNKMVLQVNLSGGAYFDFHLKEIPLNPVNWKTVNPEEPPFMGHFLCLDRWGPPSEAEKANGFRHHGEGSAEDWELQEQFQKGENISECKMSCRLPMAGLQVTRKIELSENESVFHVTEEIENLNKYGRMFNMVQHVTLAPPFLDNTTLFDNNTEKGFEDKEDGSLNQEEPVIAWPEAVHKGETISLRRFQNKWPRVSSFVFNQNQEYGWATACNPTKNLLLGYFWKTKDYPWINFWRNMENGIPQAFGIEFGTTGLHEPFPVVAKKGKIFDRNIYDFIDAREIISKSFTAFLFQTPDDYQGVEKIEFNNSYFRIREKGNNSSDLIYHQVKQ